MPVICSKKGPFSRTCRRCLIGCRSLSEGWRETSSAVPSATSTSTSTSTSSLAAHCQNALGPLHQLHELSKAGVDPRPEQLAVLWLETSRRLVEARDAWHRARGRMGAHRDLQDSLEELEVRLE